MTVSKAPHLYLRSMLSTSMRVLAILLFLKIPLPTKHFTRSPRCPCPFTRAWTFVFTQLLPCYESVPQPYGYGVGRPAQAGQPPGLRGNLPQVCQRTLWLCAPKNKGARRLRGTDARCV